MILTGILTLPGCNLGHAQSLSGQHLITGVAFEGARRTDTGWLLHYLGVPSPPFSVSDSILASWRKQLLSTRAFRQVEIQTESDKDPQVKILKFVLDEKWTMIPVIRGQTGGGTPLLVAGAYETHFLGRLLTVGGEMHKYGDAPPGGVVYFRAPRWDRNRGDLGFDLWTDIRWREVWSSPTESPGRVEISGHKFRARWLRSVAATEIQVGPELVLYSYNEADAVSKDAPPDAERLEEATRNWDLGASSGSGRLHLMLKYDDIEADNVLYDGWRLLIRNGPGKERGRYIWSSEWEAFWYQRPSPMINLAFHALVGSAGSSSVFSRYFLGGFDSVRGIPDGAVSGSKAAYLNAEFRWLTMPWKNIWFQTVVFFDSGIAREAWGSGPGQSAKGAGLGIRIIVPKIYRFVIRLDYAFDLQDPEHRSISAGLNQLFQPYRPL